MTYTWVLSNFYAGLVLGAIARVIPRAQSMIETPIYRNGAHGIAAIYDRWQTSVKA
ncbi:MAG: hypothetical protein ACYCPD_07440 [Acidobacteriaceae bacterium]